MALKEKSESLDEATELALAWAIATLKRELPDVGAEGYDAKEWDKDQQRKAQAAAIVAGLKVRVDPGAMRTQKHDKIGERLERRLRESGEGNVE